MRTFDGFGDAVLAEAAVMFVGGGLGLGWSLSLLLGFDGAGDSGGVVHIGKEVGSRYSRGPPEYE